MPASLEGAPQSRLMTVFRLLVLIFLVFVNGFFVAAEFAIVKIRMGQLEPLAARGGSPRGRRRASSAT